MAGRDAVTERMPLTAGASQPNISSAEGHDPLLLVKFTGYRLRVLVSSTAFVVPKAILGLQGQSQVPNMLDLIYGVLITTVLWWLGLYKNINPRFFHVDYMDGNC